MAELVEHDHGDEGEHNDQDGQRAERDRGGNAGGDDDRQPQQRPDPGRPRTGQTSAFGVVHQDKSPAS